MLVSPVNSITRCASNSLTSNMFGMPARSRKEPKPHQKEDAARLLAIWNKRDPKITQETAATEWGLGNTQGIVWQYLHAAIPLNLSAAIKFAAGLRCTVSDISPTLAKELPKGVGDLVPTSELKEPAHIDPRAKKIAGYFFWLTEDEKKQLMAEVESKALANRLVIKELGAKLNPVSNKRVEEALKTKPKGPAR